METEQQSQVSSSLPPAPPPPGQPRTTKAGTNTKAIWSLILGILGVYPFILIAGIPALILGYQAKRETRTWNQRGHRLAIAGIVLGWVSVSLVPILLLGCSLGSTNCA